MIGFRACSLCAVLALAGIVAGCGNDNDGAADAAAAPGSSDAADVDVPDAALPADDADTGDLLERLNAIPGLVAVEGDTMIEGYRFFLIDYDQPVDHHNPTGQRFTQRMTLLHVDEHAPTVQFSSGYYVSTQGRRSELTRLLVGNQLSIEHRYFEPSRPDPTDWSFLDIEQAAADFHRINVDLKSIYDGTWLATGASKGGMTALFFRRFYPDDVDATVSYVAPVLTAGPDPRFATFIAQVGDDAACRQALADFQREALVRRTEMLALVDQSIIENGYTFDLLGKERAFEHAVLELPFYFWQYGDATLCPDVPPSTATTADLFGFLELISSVGNVADDSVLAYTPYFYQSGTQFGWPGFPEAHLADLMLHAGTDVPASYTTATGVTLSYDDQAMADVLDWVTTSGASLMFIYGQNDPWTAAMVELGGAQDSFRFMQPAGNHGSRILGLTEADQATAITALETWMGVDIVPPMMAAPGKPAWAAEPADPMDDRVRF